MLEFPDDPRSREISDQFMLGPELLIAPVVTEGATSKTLYLPPGAWYHVWSGDSATRAVETSPSARRSDPPPVFSLDSDRPDLRAIE